MKLVVDAGLWRTGPVAPDTPLAAVLEVSGAVLSWTIDDPAGAAAVEITFTDVARADWLFRVLGESGHVALASAFDAVDDAADDARHSIELSGVDIVAGSVDALRRLAIGHWLRRWWPASRVDGIAGLDQALLDVEVALLTVGAQGFFTDDTLDSDVTQLLAPHAAALIAHVAENDPRVVELVRAGAEIADDVGVDGAQWPEVFAALDDSSMILTLPSDRRDDYALAAGTDGAPRDGTAIARGLSSITWTAVPPAIFDAAEDTVAWSVQVAGATAVAIVRASIIGPNPGTGIAVQLQAGAITGTGVLDADGRATLPLLDATQQPITAAAAWDHDWPATVVIVGARLAQTAETRDTRERVRRWVRARLERPPHDAFLAEILAAESAY